MTRSIYLVGGPGAGKSTLMARLLRGWSPGPYVRLSERELFGHRLLSDDLKLGVYLGHLRPEYPGTDALSLSVAPHALRWLQTVDNSIEWVFGEGARLSHQSFLQELAERTDLVVVHLAVDDETSAARRAARSGKPLSDQYCRIAVSKARNIAEWCTQAGIVTLSLDGTRGVEDLAKEVCATH